MSELESEFASLVNRARGDDNQALAALIAVYEPDIRNAAQVLLGKALRSSLDPTDLVQSVHLQLITALKRERFVITNPEQLRSLASTLLRNNFTSHWRHHRIRTRHHARLATAGAITDGLAAAAVGALDPARAAEYNDFVDYLGRYLRIEDQRVVVMRLQGYRSREIAAELGINPAVLRVRLSRLRKRLLDEKPDTEW
jgi:RNA polymerase sigma-70 factor (ECF subfamily)